jgi:hypothetical protein
VVPAELHNGDLKLIASFHHEALQSTEKLFVQLAGSVGWVGFDPSYGRTPSRTDRPVAWSHVKAESIRWFIRGLLLGFLFAIVVWYSRRSMWSKRGCCRSCGYPMNALAAVCSECGKLSRS